MVSDNQIIEAATRSMECSVNRTHGQLRSGLSALATIGATAPFVGLFGTVIGIVNAFRGFNGTHITGFSSVGGGISEALVTTAVGLLVAVPAVWAFNFFTNELEAFDTEMRHSIDFTSTYLAGVQAARRDR
jgi:biopolymer transport protein ExbB/TolQ